MIDLADLRRDKFKRLTNQELGHGLLREGDDFLSRAVWHANLQSLELKLKGHRLVKRSIASTGPSIKLPKRCSTHKVGKRIGGAVYVHRDYERVLGAAMAAAKSKLRANYRYTVVKHNETNGNFSFIDCPDFDTADEPSTGDYAVVKSDGTIKLHAALPDPYIYHHKWLFVAADYAGFDVAESVERSIAWLSLPDVNKSLIGRASYWNTEVVPRLTAAAEDQWLRSDEIRRRLKLTTCELAHLRDAGGLPFKKLGNAYLYRLPSAG